MNRLSAIRDKFNSRKFAGLLWGWLILFSAYDLSSLTPAIQPLYSTLVGGIIGLYAIYCGANIGSSVWGKKKNDEPEIPSVPPVPQEGEPK